MLLNNKARSKHSLGGFGVIVGLIIDVSDMRLSVYPGVVSGLLTQNI